MCARRGWTYVVAALDSGSPFESVRVLVNHRG
jgi:hypothetical protein